MAGKAGPFKPNGGGRKARALPRPDSRLAGPPSGVVRERAWILAETGLNSGFVLICDDDPLLTELLEHRLGVQGYGTAVARDGGEALAMLEGLSPDAIILDEMMPVQSGHEVLRHIREDDRLKDVPVIMLTARKQEEDIVQALELGASDYVTKPFIPNELVARLAKVIRGRGR